MIPMELQTFEIATVTLLIGVKYWGTTYSIYPRFKEFLTKGTTTKQFVHHNKA
jgi:hypothetical protein